MNSHQRISSSENFPITTYSIAITKISEIDHLKEIQVSRNSISQDLTSYISVLYLSLLVLISFGI